MTAQPKTKLNFTIRKLPPFEATTEKTREDITNVNCAAFDGNRFIGILMGGHWDLAPALQRSFVIDCLMGGVVYVVELDGKIIGDAMWHGPGQEFSKVEGAAELGFKKFMAALEKKDPKVADWWNNYYNKKYSSFTDECLKGPEFKRDGWFLQAICVLPEYQRHGIGSALIKIIDDLILNNPGAKPAERRVCLETEMEGPLKFYKAVGFAEMGETTIEGSGSLGNCTMWCLAKEM